MRRLVLPLVLPLLATVVGSCGAVPGITGACTEIGCESGIEVVLESPPAGAYRVEATVGGSAARYVYQCADEEGCAGRIFFPEFTPYRVFIEVTDATSTERYEVVPEYTEHRPNGPDCPPLCRNAVIRLPEDQLGG